MTINVVLVTAAVVLSCAGFSLAGAAGKLFGGGAKPPQTAPASEP